MKHILDLRGVALHSYHTTPYHESFTEKTEKGDKQQPTMAHGVQVFLERYLLPILDRAEPIDIIAVGEGGSDRRRALYVDYKSKESSYSPAVSAQRDGCVQAIERLLIGLGSTLIKYPKTEADDTIALLCNRLEGPKTVWTADQDLLQLMGPGTLVRYRGESVSSFKDYDLLTYGPEIVTLYKSIVGDTSDGYGGIRGLGETFFQNLVTGNVEIVSKLCRIADTRDYSGLEQLASANSLVEKIKAKSDDWFLMWQLAKLHPEWCEMTFREKLGRPVIAKRLPNIERVHTALNPLGLGSFTEKFLKYHYKPILLTASKLRGKEEGFIKALQDSPYIAYDYETYDSLKCESYQKARKGFVDVYSQEVVGVSFAYGANYNKAVYIPIRHEDTDNVSIETVKRILEAIQGYEKIAHNMAFESFISQKCFDIDFWTETYDTMHLFSHANENEDRGLKELSKTYLNYDQLRYSDVVPAGKDMRDVTGESVTQYGADDSICTLQLFHVGKLICELECTANFALKIEPYFEAAMSKRYVKGTRIDKSYLENLTVEASARQIELDKELRQLLTENCSQPNEKSALVIYEDFKPYWEALLSSKGKTEEEIKEYLEERKAELIENSAYVPWQAPSLNWLGRKAIKNVAKMVGLPALRGSKQAWVEAYVYGLIEHADERCGNWPDAFTDEQLTLIKALKAMPELLEVNMSNETYERFKTSESVEKEVKLEIERLYQLSHMLHLSNETFWIGHELNSDSPKQMIQLFYIMLGLPILMRNIDKSDSNARSEWDLEQSPSTGVNAIETWTVYEDMPDWKRKVLEIILELRALSTKFKLYFNPYPKLFHPTESTETVGVLRPSLKNCGTVTRRPTSSTPNVLQVSKKDDGEIRGAFLADSEDEVIVSIDFKQQELVILGALSRDENLLSCYTGPIENRKDVHGLTGTSILNLQNRREGKKSLSYAEFMFNVKNKDKVCVGIRKKPAKMTNFLTVYGGSAIGLARKAVVKVKEAESFIDAFFETYPKVEDYQARCTKNARRYGYVTTMYGNRKHCDGVFDRNRAIAASWERQAGNAPIQGTAADILKIVLKEAVLLRLQERTGACFIAPVYDEIVASVPKKSVVQYINEMVNIMEVTLPGTEVKLGTSVSIGKNWGQQKELEEIMEPSQSRPTEQQILKVLEEIENEC